MVDIYVYMNNFNHILNSDGILKSFNISKRVYKKDIDGFIAKHKKDCATKYALNELLKEEIFSHTDDYLRSHSIPGLKPETIESLTENSNEVTTNDNVNSDGKRKRKYHIKDPKFIKVREEAAKIGEYLQKTKNLKKDEQLFFIISIVEYLKLSDTDFEKFHDRLNNGDGFVEDDGENEDDDDEDFNFDKEN